MAITFEDELRSIMNMQILLETGQDQKQRIALARNLEYHTLYEYDYRKYLLRSTFYGKAKNILNKRYPYCRILSLQIPRLIQISMILWQNFAEGNYDKPGSWKIFISPLHCKLLLYR